MTAAADNESQRIEDIKRRLFLIGAIGVGAFAAIVGGYVYQFFGPLSDDRAVWGQFGDYVGGSLNPFLTFLSLIAILFTIVLQAREIQLSTVELRNSSQALRAQSETLRIQQFENAFFQLLHLHNSIVGELDLREQGNLAAVTTRGRDCFRVFVDRYREKWKVHERDWEALESIQSAYDEFYRLNQHEVGHYFRLLYNIIKFVDGAPIANKKFYTNLVRAQLSADELTLLFWNALSRWGRGKFKPLIEKYSLLKTLPDRKYFTPRVRAYYEARAYEGT
jgi:hypothetical protein